MNKLEAKQECCNDCVFLKTGYPPMCYKKQCPCHTQTKDADKCAGCCGCKDCPPCGEMLEPTPPKYTAKEAGEDMRKLQEEMKPAPVKDWEKEFDKEFNKELFTPEEGQEIMIDVSSAKVRSFISQQIFAARSEGYEEGARIQAGMDAETISQAHERTIKEVIEMVEAWKNGYCKNYTAREGGYCCGFHEGICTISDSLAKLTSLRAK